jgi:hypothetical protein
MGILFLTTVLSIRRFTVMEKRYEALLIALLGGLVLTLLAVRPAAAYYVNVTGELRDSKTGALWTHNATVYIFDCGTGDDIVAPILINDGSGTFFEPLPTVTPPDNQMICVEVVFGFGGVGTPGNATKGPFVNRQSSAGNLDTGVYFTGTGPLAVTLASFGASTGGSIPLLFAVIFLLVVGASLVAVRRRR